MERTTALTCGHTVTVAIDGGEGMCACIERTREQSLVAEIMENALAIQSNANFALGEWFATTPNQETRERLLMELRHDLQDALKAALALEEEVN